VQHRLTRLAALAAALALLGACAINKTAESPAGSGTPAQQRSLARYLAYAGPPIPYFTWLGQFYSWEPLSKDQLVVFTVPDEAYLLRVWPPCDLRFVIDAIGITSTARTVYAHTDSITVNSAGTGPGRWSCPIDEIRKIDYQRMKADQRNKGAPPNPAAPTTPPLPPQAALPPSAAPLAKR